MTDRDKMNAKRIYLRQLHKDQRGINPKLSLWKKLDDQIKQLETELASMGAERVVR